MLGALSALANPHRLAIVAVLHRRGRMYVSELAREIGVSRPLLHLHLARLAEADLVASRLELSPEGKALHYFELADFHFVVSPETLSAAAEALPPRKSRGG